MKVEPGCAELLLSLACFVIVCRGPTFTPHYSAERVGIINLEKKC